MPDAHRDNITYYYPTDSSHALQFREGGRLLWVKLVLCPGDRQTGMQSSHSWVLPVPILREYLGKLLELGWAFLLQPDQGLQGEAPTPRALVYFHVCQGVKATGKVQLEVAWVGPALPVRHVFARDTVTKEGNWSRTRGWGWGVP